MACVAAIWPDGSGALKEGQLVLTHCFILDKTRLVGKPSDDQFGYSVALPQTILSYGQLRTVGVLRWKN
jgi:hypothetical protein